MYIVYLLNNNNHNSHPHGGLQLEHQRTVINLQTKPSQICDYKHTLTHIMSRVRVRFALTSTINSPDATVE